jgi:hypothetical protein
MSAIVENSPGNRVLALTILLLSLILGGWLRFSGLADKGITHPEMYVPGISLPEGISEPAERKSVVKILTGTFSSDTHPPGYYLAMLPWTRVAGTGLRAIRIPSALLGLGCVALVYALGSLVGRPLSGGLAAFLVAVSGYHVFWSQVARMFAQACFLGLASTVVLLLIVRGTKHRILLSTIYVILILAGVATHVFFWALFATHMLWTFANAAPAKHLSTIARAELLALILGSPLLAFAAYQSGNTVADLSGNAIQYLGGLLGFAFLLPNSDSGFFPGPVPLSGNAWAWALRGLLLVVGAWLALAGILEARKLREGATRAGDENRPDSGWIGGWIPGWIAGGMFATLEILAFLYLTRVLPPDQIHPTIKATKILTVLPFALAAAAIAIDRAWRPVTERVPGIASPQALIALLAFLPFALLAAASQIRPLLNQRGLLFAAPYLLLLLAMGALSLRRRSMRVALGFVIGVGCVASLLSYAPMNVGAVDYGRFAADLAPQVQPGDLVFLEKIWNATPMLYYFTTSDRYRVVGRVVGRNFPSACAQNPDSRIWVVLMHDSPPTPEMSAALSQYHLVRTLMEPDGRALLYQRTD